jgi:hypothetical protein
MDVLNASWQLNGNFIQPCTTHVMPRRGTAVWLSIFGSIGTIGGLKIIHRIRLCSVGTVCAKHNNQM